MQETDQLKVFFFSLIIEVQFQGRIGPFYMAKPL